MMRDANFAGLCRFPQTPDGHGGKIRSCLPVLLHFAVKLYGNEKPAWFSGLRAGFYL
jgi:hypothetical protein